MLTPDRIEQLIAVYRDGLLQNTLPFWQKHAVDREYGGFLICLDRDGSVVSTDKPMWAHGRFVWLLSTLYNTVEPRPEWLALAHHGIEFIRQHGFDRDGRMFYSVSREGKPLRKRRYIFAETFAMIALAAYSRAAGDTRAKNEARALFRLVIEHLTTPGLLTPKFLPQTRRIKGLAIPMIMLVTAQELRATIAEPLAPEWIDRSIDEISRDFMKPEFAAVLETVGPNGEFFDNFEGRMVCPGHSIEAAWFILHEAKHRLRDQRLLDIGLQILEWSWQLGWDEEYGGILYYRDAKGKPCTEYWHDMKFWWPHNEAIIATLLAYQLTGDEKYLRWHSLVHDWAHSHFPDPEYGEWFGYLHRDGRLSSPLKGNMWKGPFHVPRMQWYCWQLLEELRAEVGSAKNG